MQNKFSALLGVIEALNPATVLSRGYSLAKVDGKIISDSSQLNPGDEIELDFNKGSAVCKVTKTKGEA